MNAKPSFSTESRVLLEVGRGELASFLGVVRKRLAANGIPFPDSALPDQAYFDRAGSALQAMGLRLWAFAPTWDESGTRETAQPGPRRRTDDSAYALQRGLGVWKLRFDGKEAELKHEKGILYVAYLITHPPAQPMHALDLCAAIREIHRGQPGVEHIADPATGKATLLTRDARLQERALGLEDAETLRALRRKEKELEAILDDDDESEPVKQEALRELEAIAEFQRKHGRGTEDSAQRAVRAVRRAIIRFHQNLTTALDINGNPHPVLHPFAVHLEKHLLIPSARYCGPASRARGQNAGCFTYEPSPGFVWRG